MIIKPILYSYPNLKKVIDITGFFENMKEEFTKLKDTDIFKKAKKEAIFVYRIQTKTKIHHGILAGVDVNEYLKGNILKHENTLIEQEKKIAHLTLQRKAIIKPVLLAHKKSDKLNFLIAKTFLSRNPKFKIKFEKENQTHELYLVDSADEIKEFEKEFRNKIFKSYIADGHHRMSTISKILQENPDLKNHGLSYILCALFAFNELDILPYNRLVHILDVVELDVILKQLNYFAEIKKITQIREPEEKHEIIMHTHLDTYSIRWKKGVPELKNHEYPVQFDIDIFNRVILGNILDIMDIRTNQRIHYIDATKGSKPILKAIENNKELLGFSFYPLKKTDFTAIADNNLILPPKSTWFEPRIRNGIIVQNILD